MNVTEFKGHLDLKVIQGLNLKFIWAYKFKVIRS